MKKRILGAAVAAATSAAILLSACGVDAPAGEAEPRDPQDGGAPSTGSSGNSGTAPAQTSGVASGQEAARRALAAAKARWRDAGLSAYSFRFVRYCECDESFGGPFDVRVVDERVLDFRRAGVQADLAAATTISELFVAIAAAIDRRCVGDRDLRPSVRLSPRGSAGSRCDRSRRRAGVGCPQPRSVATSRPMLGVERGASIAAVDAATIIVGLKPAGGVA